MESGIIFRARFIARWKSYGARSADDSTHRSDCNFHQFKHSVWRPNDRSALSGLSEFLITCACMCEQQIGIDREITAAALRKLNRARQSFLLNPYSLNCASATCRTSDFPRPFSPARHETSPPQLIAARRETRYATMFLNERLYGRREESNADWVRRATERLGSPAVTAEQGEQRERSWLVRFLETSVHFWSSQDIIGHRNRRGFCNDGPTRRWSADQ